VQGLFDDDDDKAARDDWPAEKKMPEEAAVLSSYTPPTQQETVRQSGLAYSAGLAFFAAILFMGFLGWLADQILGHAPWGIVGGIVLGSIIGFIQFFRISSQIFKNNSSGPAEHPLMTQPQKRTDRRDRFDEPGSF
jgi:F0F1-type ATP synthase assembly protein I